MHSILVSLRVSLHSTLGRGCWGVVVSGRPLYCCSSAYTVTGLAEQFLLGLLVTWGGSVTDMGAMLGYCVRSRCWGLISSLGGSDRPCRGKDQDDRCSPGDCRQVQVTVSN